MRQKTVLITGCSSGIGLAAARVLKARGWRVLATARKPHDLEMLSQEIGVEPLALELAEPSSIEQCAQEALRMTGGEIDALFNNAAFGQVGAVEDLSGDILRQQMEVNFIGTHDLTRRLIPAMRERGSGRIVQCSSVLGFTSLPFRGAYCASKYALEALSDAMRHELKGTGIKVSLIEPGPIRTRFIENIIARFESNIDVDASPHREAYGVRLAAMKAGGRSMFKLEPEAVVGKLIHALESRRPKVRYYVTVPTYLVAGAKRVLPQSLSDVLAKMI